LWLLVAAGRQREGLVGVVVLAVSEQGLVSLLLLGSLTQLLLVLVALAQAHRHFSKQVAAALQLGAMLQMQ
jgi:hypothetical protein